MAAFKGFPEGRVRHTPIPEPFFGELLVEIDDLAELKLTMYVFWRLNRIEGVFRYLRRGDFTGDTEFMLALSSKPDEAIVELDRALDSSVRRGVLLLAQVELGRGPENFYFLNSPKGRAAVQAIARGEWRNSEKENLKIALRDQSPNIFELYEQNIGVLTPLIAEALREAEDTYPSSWIEDAFKIALENNTRNWRYVNAILNRWQVEGRDDREDRRDTEKARRRYAEDG